MVFRFFFMSFSFGAVDPRVEALCPISAHYSCRDQTRCLSSLTLIPLPELSIPSFLSKILIIFLMIVFVAGIRTHVHKWNNIS